MLGGRPFEGSLNFYADAPVAFPKPALASIAGEEWWLAPVVIADRADGVAARKAASGNIAFIEVFAREELVPRLGLTAGCRVRIRLLPARPPRP
jgi:hypothetical protein